MPSVEGLAPWMSWISEQAAQAKSDHDKKKKKNPSEAGKIISGGVNDVNQRGENCRGAISGETKRVTSFVANSITGAMFVLPHGGNLFSALFEVKVSPLGTVLSPGAVHTFSKKGGEGKQVV